MSGSGSGEDLGSEGNELLHGTRHKESGSQIGGKLVGVDEETQASFFLTLP